MANPTPVQLLSDAEKHAIDLQIQNFIFQTALSNPAQELLDISEQFECEAFGRGTTSVSSYASEEAGSASARTNSNDPPLPRVPVWPSLTTEDVDITIAMKKRAEFAFDIAKAKEAVHRSRMEYCVARAKHLLLRHNKYLFKEAVEYRRLKKASKKVAHARERLDKTSRSIQSETIRQ